MGIFGRKVDDEFDALINAMGRLLHGKGADLQRAVLTDIVSRWIMGHHPSLRRQALAMHVQAVRDLIELNEEALSARNRGEPEDW
jgi:LPS sulfotransferase NodH